MKLFLILLAFLLTACGEWFRQAPPAIPGSGIPIHTPNPHSPLPQNPAGTEQNSSAGPLSEFGDVRCHSNQITQFNREVRNFLSTSHDPNKATYIIKCSPQQNSKKSGFFIRGKVYFEGHQKFNPQSSDQNLTVSSNSHLEIHIIDLNGRPVTLQWQNNQGQAIKMNIEPQASTIRGLDVILTFQDQNTQGQALGKVFLDGSVQPDNQNRPIFSGTFKFENFITWSGSYPGLSGAIGTFRISACHFFDCDSPILPEVLPR